VKIDSLLLSLVLSLWTTFPLISRAQDVPAPADAPKEVTIESCPGDIKQMADRAVKRGYEFKTVPTRSEGVCSIDEVELILILSATAKDDLVCNFELFAPPDGKKFGGQRIAVKAGSGANTRYVQRGADPRRGFMFSLEAKKGQTSQFRVVAIDVAPIGNKCSGPITEGAVQ
jgi:hypothetical protein